MLRHDLQLPPKQCAGELFFFPTTIFRAISAKQSVDSRHLRLICLEKRSRSDFGEFLFLLYFLCDFSVIFFGLEWLCVRNGCRRLSFEGFLCVVSENGGFFLCK